MKNLKLILRAVIALTGTGFLTTIAEMFFCSYSGEKSFDKYLRLKKAKKGK